MYQYVEMGHHCEEHLHLKCVSCGCIIHLECAFMQEISEHILEDHGFKLQCKNSIIYGLCRECREKTGTGNNTAIGFPYNRLMVLWINTFSIDLI